jgi:hypothetical protein
MIGLAGACGRFQIPGSDRRLKPQRSSADHLRESSLRVSCVEGVATAARRACPGLRFAYKRELPRVSP